MIGELSILDIDEDNQNAGFRISMASISLAGKGYGTEAIKIVLRSREPLLYFRLSTWHLAKKGHNKKEKHLFSGEGRQPFI